eukprot:jgi/Botrbrau1/7229/Bobra.0021s0014.1
MADWPADQPAAAGSEYLVAGAVLESGQFLKSGNDLSRAILQADGNLVVYRKERSGIVPGYSTGTTGATKLVNQADDNLVLYGADDTPIWTSGTSRPSNTLLPTGNAYLTLTDDGVLVYSGNGLQLWDSISGIAEGGIPSGIPPPPEGLLQGQVPAPEAPPVPVEAAPVEPVPAQDPAPVPEEPPLEPLETLAPAEAAPEEPPSNPWRPWHPRRLHLRSLPSNPWRPWPRRRLRLRLRQTLQRPSQWCLRPKCWRRCQSLCQRSSRRWSQKSRLLQSL